MVLEGGHAPIYLLINIILTLLTYYLPSLSNSSRCRRVSLKDLHVLVETQVCDIYYEYWHV